MKRIYQCNNDEKLLRVITDNKVHCKCGHSIFIPRYVKKTTCTWCHRTVYRDEKEEFKDKLFKQIGK